MPKFQTPNAIRALLTPTAKKSDSRKVWSIDLQQVWLPFFTATNAQGDTSINREDIGCPLRLATAKDGTPKFNDNGRPIMRVAKGLSTQIQLVRENFIAGLVNYTSGVYKMNPEAVKAESEACYKAGVPIMEQANKEVSAYVETVMAAKQAEEAIAAAASTPAEAKKELVGAAA